MTRAADLKVEQVCRRLGSLIAVVVCGYLSLGTSCESGGVEKTTSVVLHFEPGQPSAVLMVQTEGGRLLRLHFDGEFIVRRDGMPVEPPSGPQHEGYGQPGGTFCGLDPEPTVYDPAPSPGTHCKTDEALTGPVLYEVVRQDTTEALDVIATGTLLSNETCDGEAPDRVGLVLEAEPTP